MCRAVNKNFGKSIITYKLLLALQPSSLSMILVLEKYEVDMVSVVKNQ